MLNMAYMLVQMLYGVWTNSLGLISDGTARFPCQNCHSDHKYSNTYGLRLYGYRCRSICIGYGYLGAERKIYLWVCHIIISSTEIEVP